MKTINYGWYSQKMYEKCGAIVYSSPNGEVTVTCVTNNKIASGLGYDDVVFVGELYDFIRREESAESAKSAKSAKSIFIL